MLLMESGIAIETGEGCSRKSRLHSEWEHTKTSRRPTTSGEHQHLARSPLTPTSPSLELQLRSSTIIPPLSTPRFESTSPLFNLDPVGSVLHWSSDWLSPSPNHSWHSAAPNHGTPPNSQISRSNLLIQFAPPLNYPPIDPPRSGRIPRGEILQSLCCLRSLLLGGLGGSIRSRAVSSPHLGHSKRRFRSASHEPSPCVKKAYRRCPRLG